jgi:ABC-type branched-subunit amino acid transport system ATPase component
MPSIPLLECRQVSKHYGALAAVNAIDLQIDGGQTVGIGGPNGAGKTTFFDLISGLTAVTSGQVLFNGSEITGIPPHRLFHKGMARTFQVTSGFASLTVLENMLASLVYGTGTERPGLLDNKITSRSIDDLFGGLWACRHCSSEGRRHDRFCRARS